MQVTVETTQGLERRMRVEIPEERVRGEVDKRLGDLARSVRNSGIPSGKGAGEGSRAALRPAGSRTKWWADWCRSRSSTH